MKSLWLLLPLTSGLALAQTDKPQQNPFQNDPQAVEAGRGTFRIYCSPCHGIHAEGGRGPDLTRGTYSAGERDADLFGVIMTGVSGTEMPSFSVSLGQENTWRVVSYIRSTTRHNVEKPSGDPLSGEKLFWGKGGCGGCHRVGARAEDASAPISHASGRTRSLDYLRRSR